VIDIKNISTFNLSQPEKEEFLLERLHNLTEFHLENCQEYSSLMNKFGRVSAKAESIEEVPFLPVRLFKHVDLLSIPQDKVIKTMTSSGTSGQAVSCIYLDKETSALQVKVLSRIVSDFIGTKRLPMLVIDSKSIVSNRKKFSARTAGVLGFSMFGRDVEFALDDDMSLNLDRIREFLGKYKDENILIFGFTFIVWKHFVEELEKLDVKVNISNGILIHGGGWKQIESQSVSNEEYKKRLFNISNIERVHNYYGMVEQTGSIFMECEYGFLHASSFSDIIIRDHANYDSKDIGKRGLIQLLSVIPKSYPGHSLLSEDIGEIYGIDDCKCGRKGKYFKVYGRIKNAETRGCSDTYT
jgi:phenylacetate-coenzyme A ligase PaaK-like adenylate-forming protein